MAFNNYPYTDFHELNADWIIKTVQELSTKVDELETEIAAGLSLDPVLHSGTKIADYALGDESGSLYAPDPTSIDINPIVTTGTKIAEITINDYTTEELYAPSAGSTEVEVTQVQTTGTKIATIDVDGDSTDIYAPTPTTPTTVTVTQKTTTGTNIADITVNGTTTQLYAPSGGGGGVSSVTVTPTILSGTKIGTIDVDGTDTDLYAPSAGNSYSTTEQVIGTWIDGKPLYQITMTGTSPSSINVSGNVLNITSLDIEKLISLESHIDYINNGILENVTFRGSGSYGDWLRLEDNKYYIGVNVTNSTYISKTYTATLRYTKTTD